MNIKKILKIKKNNINIIYLNKQNAESVRSITITQPSISLQKQDYKKHLSKSNLQLEGLLVIV